MKRRFGCSRTVYLVGRWAIKTPSAQYGLTKFLLGWHSNRMEANRWSWCTGTISEEALCPVLGSYLLGLVLVMTRADEVDYEELLPGELRELERHGGDVHSGNVGRLDGRLVLVDYA